MTLYPSNAKSYRKYLNCYGFESIPFSEFRYVDNKGQKHFAGILIGLYHENAAFSDRQFVYNSVPPPEMFKNIIPVLSLLEIFFDTECSRTFHLYTSGYRNPHYNLAVKGATGSQHTENRATDFLVAGESDVSLIFYDVLVRFYLPTGHWNVYHYAGKTRFHLDNSQNRGEPGTRERNYVLTGG